MRKVYLDNLPKRGKLIDWKGSVGHKVKFIYDDIKGEIEITDYKNGYLTLLYNKEIRSITTINIQNGCLGKVVGVASKKYRYNIGDIINGLEILEHVRIKDRKYTKKGYKVRCIKDGYTYDKGENSLDQKNGCPVCCNQKIIKGINDIATTHPEYVKYFVNIEDAYTHSYASNKKINLKCPDCEFKKEMSVNKLSYYDFQCPKCSDGKSYPEKLVFNLLEQLDIEFETEKVFNWVKDKRYDFYISGLNCIIETHGRQHYENSTSSKWDNLEITQQNDIHKQQLAINNNIKKYIVLDCRKSNLEWIKNSILNSELAKILDLSKVNWLKCHEFACSSRVKEACDLWNSGVRSTKGISEIMKVSVSAIKSYLRQGVKLNWCDYNGRENRNIGLKKGQDRSKKCRVVLNNKETIYNSRKECIIVTGLSERIVDTLLKSKEPFKPFFSRHKHLDGMRIEYI